MFSRFGENPDVVARLHGMVNLQVGLPCFKCNDTGQESILFLVVRGPMSRAETVHAGVLLACCCQTPTNKHGIGKRAVIWRKRVFQRAGQETVKFLPERCGKMWER